MDGKVESLTDSGTPEKQISPETVVSGGREVAAPPVSPSVQRDGAEALAHAIASTLGGVMREFDNTCESAARSQDELSRSIDRLNGELDKLLEDAPPPVIMQHAPKISSIKKRVSALNSLLKSIQQRIDNIDLMLSAGVSHDTRPPVMKGRLR